MAKEIGPNLFEDSRSGVAIAVWIATPDRYKMIEKGMCATTDAPKRKTKKTLGFTRSTYRNMCEIYLCKPVKLNTVAHEVFHAVARWCHDEEIAANAAGGFTEAVWKLVQDEKGSNGISKSNKSK